MVIIKNNIEYEAICQRIEELLPMIDNDTPITDRRLIELSILSDLVVDYEKEHYPIGEQLQYKSFTGSVECSKEEDCLFGKVLDVDGLILYEGKTLTELEV